MKTPKTSPDEFSGSVTKPTASFSALQSRSSTAQQQLTQSLAILNSMSKSVSLSNHDAGQTLNSDLAPSALQTKTSMSTSLYNTALSSTGHSHEVSENNNSNNNQSTESIGSSIPAVLSRSGKTPIGTRVLPLLESNADSPPVRLRHFQSEKKSKKISEIVPDVKHAFRNHLSFASHESIVVD